MHSPSERVSLLSASSYGRGASTSDEDDAPVLVPIGAGDLGGARAGGLAGRDGEVEVGRRGGRSQACARGAIVGVLLGVALIVGVLIGVYGERADLFPGGERISLSSAAGGADLAVTEERLAVGRPSFGSRPRPNLRAAGEDISRLGGRALRKMWEGMVGSREGGDAPRHLEARADEERVDGDEARDEDASPSTRRP